MNNPSDRVRFVHISLRIPMSVESNLKEDSTNQHISFNALASEILTKYTTFDRIATYVDAIPLNGRLFVGLLEDASVERLEELGRELGSELIKQAFTFLNLEYTVDGLIRHYFRPMSSFSTWYTFTVAGNGHSRRLMFMHHRGPNWSAFLKAYIPSIIKAATGVEPRATADEHIVTVFC